MFGEHGRYIGNINPLWWWASFSPTGLVCVRVVPRYKWWQRWNDVNCRTGVTLPTSFPGQVSGRNFSEGEINNVCETLICKLVYLFIVFGEHGRYIGNINHFWWWTSFHRRGLCVCQGRPTLQYDDKMEYYNYFTILNCVNLINRILIWRYTFTVIWCTNKIRSASPKTTQLFATENMFQVPKRTSRLPNFCHREGHFSLDVLEKYFKK